MRGHTVVSVEQFIAGLSRSGLMTADEVQGVLVSLPPEMQPPTINSLAAELVRRGTLTKFQVGRIALGQPSGLVLGKYIIQDKIGEGGMGEVFVAEHRRMKRPVVVKILPATAMESEYSIRRFQREVEAAAKLQHPNIVTAFDAGEEHGIHFLVMEYVEGEPLGSLISKEGPFTLTQALSCVLQTAQGLEYAHAQGVVHRDIKPNNLLLNTNGEVKILDMGLARIEDGTATISVKDGDSLTQKNQIVGTIEYMSPEQVDDSSQADGRSDIYSLGCTFYRLLTDEPPFHGDSIVKTLLAHRMKPVPSIRDKRPEAPAELDEIMQRMMAKLPEDRYQSATELLEDLKACIQVVQQAPPHEAIPRHDAGLGIHDSKTAIIEGDSQQDFIQALQNGAEVTVDMVASEDTRDDSGLTSPSIQETLQATAVGIDLGTTFSALAFLDDVGRPQVLPNEEGDKTTPSVVLVDDGDIIVGKEAVKAMSTDMESIAECAKRDLGNATFHQKLGGREYPPEVIQAWVLNKLRTDACQRLGDFTKAVVTVPAYFDEVRRKATQDAGYLAGLEVLDIINEPTAAALAFGFQQGRLDISGEGDPQRVLVYDLGGGTFDVSIMEIGSGEFVTRATDGDVQLGGRDWDQRLVDFVAETFLDTHGFDPREDPNTLGRLLRECEDAKRTLSARSRAHVACDFRGVGLRVEVSRDRFEELTLDLLERTAFTIRHTMQTAGLEWDDLDYILLVGGSTRMPAVVEMLRRVSGKQPDTSISPDEAVAQGAAIYAGLLLEKIQGRPPRVRVRNVNSHSLGLVATDPRTSRRQTAVLIPRNTPLPAKAQRVFKTLKTDQKSIVVNIVEGESRDPLECTQIGKCMVRDLPADLPAGTPVEVRFQYEENGRLQVSVNVADVQSNVTHDITRANNLSPEQLEHWRREVTGT